MSENVPESEQEREYRLATPLIDLVSRLIAGGPGRYAGNYPQDMAMRLVRRLLELGWSPPAETAPPEFTALDWFDVKGRGRVATVAWGRTAGEARGLRGTRVTIDGDLYIVTGVETHAMADSCIEKIIGLLVRAPSADEGGP